MVQRHLGADSLARWISEQTDDAEVPWGQIEKVRSAKGFRVLRLVRGTYWVSAPLPHDLPLADSANPIGKRLKIGRRVLISRMDLHDATADNHLQRDQVKLLHHGLHRSREGTAQHIGRRIPEVVRDRHKRRPDHKHVPTQCDESKQWPTSARSPIFNHDRQEATPQEDCRSKTHDSRLSRRRNQVTQWPAQFRPPCPVGVIDKPDNRRCASDRVDPRSTAPRSSRIQPCNAPIAIHRNTLQEGQRREQASQEHLVAQTCLRDLLC